VIEVPHTAVVAREEIFGPVMAVVRFTDTDEVLRMANDIRMVSLPRFGPRISAARSRRRALFAQGSSG
jgi:Aldehyde dehydrogenase family